MPLKIVEQSVKVWREPEWVWPTIGKPFRFTEEEVTEIETKAPDALSPINVIEAQAIVAASTEESGEPDAGKPAPRKKGAAAADLSDL